MEIASTGSWRCRASKGRFKCIALGVRVNTPRATLRAMKLFIPLTALALLLPAAVLAQPPGRVKRTVTDAEVMRVHRSTILIDTHNDVTSFTVDGMDIGKPSPDRMTDLPRMKQGGMSAQFFAAYVDSTYVKENKSAGRALQMIDTVLHDIVEKYPNDFLLVTSSSGIRKAHEQGKIGALIGIEGGHAIEDSLRLLRDYYDLGVRYMTLTHANSNHWADSSGDANQPNNGLSPLGREVVHEMNRLGMMVDIAHVSDKTFWDALQASQAPIFSSHSSCRAIADVPRNMTDQMIEALGRKGGVIQINFSCGFLKKGAGSEGAPRATLTDVVAHINHAVQIAGVDAVGLGSDFDGITCAPEGLDSVEKWPNLTRALLEEGYTAEEIRKIYGENTLRVMAAVEQTARRMR
jgi:membrane dipeptidase